MRPKSTSSVSGGNVARPGLRLRQLGVADLGVASALEAAAYGSDSWNRATLEDELRSRFAHYVLAETATPGGLETPVGMAGVWFMRDQLHVATLAVDPHWRRRGIASRLLEHCIELAREAELGSIALEVQESNVGARALYERFGFRSIGKLRGYYGASDRDAVVMELAVRGVGSGGR